MSAHDYFAGTPAVGLEEVLQAREKRAAMQQRLAERHAKPQISFTLNIPGPYKTFPLAQRAFHEGCTHIDNHLKRLRLPVLHCGMDTGAAGFTGHWSVACSAPELKAQMMQIEEGHPLGRLFDIDVLDENAHILRGTDQGRRERPCLICDGPVWLCARSRAHDADSLAAKAVTLINAYFHGRFANTMAFYAQRALLYEVAATPKPGLVDRANNGAHSDMDYFTFMDSAAVLYPYFQECVWIGQAFSGTPEALMEKLRFSGMCAEDDMRAANCGVNTHKGAIFSLGILCAAAGYLWAAKSLNQETLLAYSGRMAAHTLKELMTAHPQSNGEKQYQEHGITGIRGEAASGFEHVRAYALPALKKALEEGHSKNDASISALLQLLAHVTDTNIIRRSSLSTHQCFTKAVQDFLDTAPSMQQMVKASAELDHKCIHRNISPGGCADLLAVTWMLWFCFSSGEADALSCQPTV